MTVREQITFWLPWLISALTILHTTLIGNKDVRGWAVALFNQLLWTVWVLVSASWGLLPLNVALWVIYTRNYRKWKREQVFRA